MPQFRILAPTAILGYGFPEDSFERGLSEEPHMVAVDAGSTDPGPYYLGSGKSFTDRAAVKRDLRIMLRACVERRIPLVVGSAGGAGAAPHLAWSRAIVEEIAAEDELSFSMAVIPTDVPKALLHDELTAGSVVSMSCAPDLTHEAIEQSSHIVAQIGVEPISEALAAGADVVLAGRAYDPACFAALPILRGFDPGLALHCGKILECAALAASPGSGADCALGILERDRFLLKALSGKRKFTVLSTAAHTMYEKSDPYLLPGPGGVLDLSRCTFVEIGEGVIEVKGSKYVEAERPMIKLEGARRVGFRAISIAGIRDPIMIGSIRAILDAVSGEIRKIFAEKPLGRVHFHCYGLDGVMRASEPFIQAVPHEIGLVIEAVAETQRDADTLCSIVRSTLLHYGYPGRIATAGNLAFPFSPSDLSGGAVYEFSVYHLIPATTRLRFPAEFIDVRAGSSAA
jgi:hypothetical protein